MRFTRTVALTAAAATIATPVVLLTAGPAAADTERHGACRNGVYELSVDREGRFYETSVDLDGVTPGTTWRVVIRHNGTKVAARKIVADREGDVELETFRANKPGKDTWRFKARQIGTGQGCGAAITVA
jgi:hypothetical protein